jgi:hypothetical protein
MPSHIEEALALVALELAAQAFTTVAFIVVQPYAVEWRWASVLLPLVQLLQEHITRHAPDTIPTHRATRALATGIERSATATPIRRCRCRLPRRQQRAGRRLNWSRLSEQKFRVDKWSLCRVRPPRGAAEVYSRLDPGSCRQGSNVVVVRCKS